LIRDDKLRDRLEALYRAHDHRDLVHPDPLEFLYRYPGGRDREVAGVVASALAYGRVAQINRSVATALSPLGPSPRDFLLATGDRELSDLYHGFCHRFCRGPSLAALLAALGRVLQDFGTLEDAFLAGLLPKDETVLPALDRFVDLLARSGCPSPDHLIPRPRGGSACKRWNLFLRWMVRCDQVDPGGWSRLSPALLVVPLDVHMHRVCRELGLTARSAPNLKTALEITRAFRDFSPDDPVRYDFALTRVSMAGESVTRALAHYGRKRV